MPRPRGCICMDCPNWLSCDVGKQALEQELAACHNKIDRLQADLEDYKIEFGEITAAQLHLWKQVSEQCYPCIKDCEEVELTCCPCRPPIEAEKLQAEIKAALAVISEPIGHNYSLHDIMLDTYVECDCFSGMNREEWQNSDGSNVYFDYPQQGHEEETIDEWCSDPECWKHGIILKLRKIEQILRGDILAGKPAAPNAPAVNGKTGAIASHDSLTGRKDSTGDEKAAVTAVCDECNPDAGDFCVKADESGELYSCKKKRRAGAQPRQIK